MVDLKKKNLKLDPIAKINNNLWHNLLYSCKKKIGFSTFQIEIFNDQKSL